MHPVQNAVDDSAAARTAAIGTPQPCRRPQLLRLGGGLLASAGLFILYFRQSQVASFNSDGAAQVLQAQDMLHGNLLLRGWWTGDVSFYTTELPEYMLVDLFRGLRPDVVHICGALTYTLAVLLAALLARGRATGLAGLVRALLAVGVMLAPSVAGGTPVLLENHDHFGTAVPILLILLVIDRARERWYIPVAVCVLLTWAQVADDVALVAVAVPVAAAATVRLVVLATRPRPLRGFWYDTALGAAAAVSILLAAGTEKAIRALGGFDLLPLPQQLLVTRSQLPGHIRALGETLLLLFGANGQGNGGLAFLAWFHCIGLALAGLALLAAVAWYLTRADRVTQVIVAGTAAMMTAAIFTIELASVGQAHEVAVLLPFGAVLAGRVLPGLLPGKLRPARRTLLPVGGAWLAAALAALCYTATGTPAAAENMPLAGWLTAHGYTEGLAAYWQAGSTTVDSGGKTLLAPVTPGGSAVYAWEADAAWYDPGTHRADFVVAMANPNGPLGGIPVNAGQEFFGPPAHAYRVDGYVIMVYRYNLLTRLAGNPPAQ
ncbi:MAG: hypothetical protein ACRDN0_15745 [Trebonia sp.]